MVDENISLVPPRIALVSVETGRIEKAWSDLIEAFFRRLGGSDAMSISDLEIMVSEATPNALIAQLAQRVLELEAQLSDALDTSAALAELAKRVGDLESQIAAFAGLPALVADHVQHIANLASQGTVTP